MGPKIVALPHLNAAISSRGPKLFLPLIADHLGSRHARFDDLVEKLREEIQVLTLLYSHVFQLCAHGADFDLVLAGWSEARQQPESYFISTREQPGVPAWSVCELDPLAGMPMDDETAARFEASLTDEERRGVISDPVDFLLRLAEAQRQLKAIQGQMSEATHGVGGFAQLTIIMPTLIQTSIVRRWPDQIGERIDPVAAAADSHTPPTAVRI
ncbi:MAG: hypothetical protein ACRED5_12690 [Propylenella sp.]